MNGKVKEWKIAQTELFCFNSNIEKRFPVVSCNKSYFVTFCKLKYLEYFYWTELNKDKQLSGGVEWKQWIKNENENN